MRGKDRGTNHFMNKQEAHFITTQLLPFFKSKNGLPDAFAWEAKSSRGKDYINFSELSGKEIRNLHQVVTGTFAHKMSDLARIGTPFDGFYFRKCTAYVIVDFPGGFYFIDILDWENEERISERKV